MIIAAARVVLRVSGPELDDALGETATSDQQQNGEDIIKVEYTS